MSLKAWFLAIGFSLWALQADFIDAAGIVDDINNLSERTKLTVDAFMQKTELIRLKCEFSDQFTTSKDKQKLRSLAQEAGERLYGIEKIQKALKKRIEDYQGEDWDVKYGQTGFWRKLDTSIYVTKLSKYEVDFYTALTAEWSEKEKILQEILAGLDLLDSQYSSADSEYLRAKTTSLLAEIRLAYKPSALSRFNSLINQADIPERIRFRAILQRLKLTGQSGPNKLTALVSEVHRSKCTDDQELILPLAFMMREQNYPEAFEQIVSFWLASEETLGRIMLSHLSHLKESNGLTEQKLEKVSIFEVELAAWTIRQDDTGRYNALLEDLSNVEKFQTPLILYITAAGSVETTPAKTVNLLIKSSQLQQIKKSGRLDIKAREIAKQAAQLAYDLSVRQSRYCGLSVEAFDNYSTIAGEKIEEELEYLYTLVLNDCGGNKKDRSYWQK